jgi:hypothetical protein
MTIEGGIRNGVPQSCTFGFLHTPNGDHEVQLEEAILEEHDHDMEDVEGI